MDTHPYELLTKTCWKMDGADKLRFPRHLTDHRTKVNAVTRGQPGRNTSRFDDEMWLDLEDFFEEYNKMLPRKMLPRRVEPPTVALLYSDNKCRFEFKCIAGLQLATRKGSAFWSFKIRAVQGHRKKAVQKAAAKDTFNATLVYAGGGAMALSKVSLTGKPLATLDETPGVIYHRTTRSNWKGIVETGFVPGGGESVSSPHTYFADKSVTDDQYISGVRAERPVEIRIAMKEAGQAGIVFIRTVSDGILTKDVIPQQFVLSVEDTDKKSNLHIRQEETEKVAKVTCGENCAATCCQD